MKGIEVVQPGLFSTVQDLGRPGYGHLGISACGAADALALRLANLLLANPPNAAGVELTLLGGHFRFHEAAWFVLTGAEFDARLDASPVALYAPRFARAGQELTLGDAAAGARGYLAVGGGIATAPVLGSRSTHVGSALGGLEGRALRRGDLLPLSDGAARRPVQALLPGVLERLRPSEPAIRILDSAQTGEFPAPARERLSIETWTVQTHSNRMGVRLDGPAMESPRSGCMTTEGAPLGAIQVLPSGAPVILFVDHQTTGGYPKIGCVLSADLWRVAQLRPRDEVRFARVSPAEARQALLDQEELLRPEVAIA
jgi:urea carboxylase